MQGEDTPVEMPCAARVGTSTLERRWSGVQPSPSRPVAIGLVVGAPLAWGAGRLVQFLFGVAPTDPATVAVIATVFLAAGWMGQLRPRAPRGSDGSNGSAPIRIGAHPGSFHDGRPGVHLPGLNCQIYFCSLFRSRTRSSPIGCCDVEVRDPSGSWVRDSAVSRGVLASCCHH